MQKSLIRIEPTWANMKFTLLNPGVVLSQSASQEVVWNSLTPRGPHATCMSLIANTSMLRAIEASSSSMCPIDRWLLTVRLCWLVCCAYLFPAMRRLGKALTPVALLLCTAESP